MFSVVLHISEPIFKSKQKRTYFNVLWGHVSNDVLICLVHGELYIEHFIQSIVNSNPITNQGIKKHRCALSAHVNSTIYI